MKYTKDISELGRRRFICIGEFPGNPYKIGEVIYRDESIIAPIENYPAVFRELFWHENRQTKEMPMYVYVTTDFYTKHMDSFGDTSGLHKGTIWKVRKWESQDSHANAMALCEGSNTYLWVTSAMPATEQQYKEAKIKTYKYMDLESFPFGKKIEFKMEQRWLIKNENAIPSR